MKEMRGQRIFAFTRV